MLPGPSAPLLVLELVGFAAYATWVGEGIRVLVARWVPSWQRLDPLERLLLDLYLGGALLYLVAAPPLGLFTLPVLGAAAVVAGGVILAGFLRRAPVDRRASFGTGLRSLGQWPILVTVGAALGLLVFEVFLAVPVGTGNTYDSSLLTLYTARLLSLHQLSYSFLPYANVGILYPQGTTAWLGGAQLLLGLPGARTSLLLTPLFFALAPVGGYVLGRRLFDRPWAGVAFALTLALLASWTRVLVGGSNDFVLAFPLVLLLVAQGSEWLRTSPHWGDAVAFGVLTGYSAALNPVGAEWLIPALLVAAVISRPEFAGASRPWLGRWTTALALALLPLLPTWYVLSQGAHSPHFVPGGGASTAGTSFGISLPSFVGSIDPYLFGPSDTWLSPSTGLRLELAVLLTAGLGLLVLMGRTFDRPGLGRFRTMFASSFVVLLGLLGVELLASTGWAPAVDVTYLTSAQELSIWLFVWYGFVAALPLVLALEWATSRPAASPSPGASSEPAEGSRRGNGAPGVARWAPLLVVFLLLLPGLALTPTQIAPPVAALYHDFGNVTADDFALLAYLGAHLPSGARLLAAPGSAAQFVPAYDRDVVLLYPMVPGWTGLNASYNRLVSELTNGTLDPAGTSAMQALDVEYIAVTGASTTLWPPFEPAPLLAAPAEFPVLFESGPDFVFGVDLG